MKQRVEEVYFLDDFWVRINSMLYKFFVKMKGLWLFWVLLFGLIFIWLRCELHGTDIGSELEYNRGD